ncbi:hypothetical protein AB9F29_00865 [Falsihalocynthiibacter sp. S25ZX9]|uniref:hypothetical protein n=1 Tax=Falsihalocynthiibacter sp. S25ZX9 TaxID=3240870 RepID=UPI003510899F
MTLKLLAKPCVCAMIIFLAGCQATTTPVQESDAPDQEITTISQLEGAPSGAKTSLVADPNEQSFFSRLSGNKANNAEATIATGPAPLGVAVKACGISKRAMGTKIEGYPAKGSKLFLYDSNPSTKAPHDFYITGFSDNCPRKFTAAVAMFGDLQLHEIMRYEVKEKSVPYSDTDMAYEVIKGQKCNVGKGVACGEKKMNTLAKSTALVTLYGAFGGVGEWAEVLLHNGKIRASTLVK